MKAMFFSKIRMTPCTWRKHVWMYSFHSQNNICENDLL